INEQLGKGKDVTSEVATDYARILLEFKANRLPENLIRDVENKVVNKLADVLTNDFPQTEEAYAKVHSELNASRQQPAEVPFAAQSAVAKLLAKLRDIRAGIGEGLSIKKIISDFEDQIKQRYITKQILDLIQKERGKEIREVVVHTADAPVSLMP